MLLCASVGRAARCMQEHSQSQKKGDHLMASVRSRNTMYSSLSSISGRISWGNSSANSFSASVKTSESCKMLPVRHLWSVLRRAL